MIGAIPYQRLLGYGLAVCLLPLLLVFLVLFRDFRQLGGLREELKYTHAHVADLMRQQAPNRVARRQYLGANQFFLDQELESLSLLEREKKMLRETLQTQGDISQEGIERRLQFLEDGNKISFAEGNIEKTLFFQEAVATLQKKVEIDLTDLKRLLGVVEGLSVEGVSPPPNPPQLIVLDFALEEQKGLGQNETYSLGLKLLKREFS